ncbi:2755_t:CDS:2, partial [Scutellospora calospora]
GVLGSIIPLALNWNSSEGSVNDGTYIGFIILMGLGSLLAFALLPPEKVIRDDGQHIIIQKFPKWEEELIGVAKILINWKMIALFPMFIASNWFYAYQFNDINAFYFNIRTRAFNSLWYWTAQIIGAALFGKFLDFPKLGRRNRGILGLAIIAVILTGIWMGGLFFQLTYKREDKDTIVHMDLYDSGYLSRIVLYIAYGGAISWRIDAVGTPFLVQLIICWALLAISIPFAFPVVFKIKETNVVSNSGKEKFDSVAANKSEITA